MTIDKVLVFDNLNGKPRDITGFKSVDIESTGITIIFPEDSKEGKTEFFRIQDIENTFQKSGTLTIWTKKKVYTDYLKPQNKKT